MDDIKRAAEYCRYSSDNQDYASIDAQKRAIEEFCAKNGITIVRTYIDEAETATEDDRAQFLTMIDDAALNMFDFIIVHKLDRFARNRYDSAIYRKKLKKSGVRIISVLENFDENTPEGVMLISVLEGMAEYYSMNLGREVKKGLKENALKCQHTGGKPPLGYNVGPDKRYVINPVEAEAIKTIFSMYAAGHGFSDILAALKDYKTKYGKAFGKNSLHDILKNEKYTGVYFFGRSIKHPDGSRNHDTKNPDIRIENGVPVIIDRETFERVQARMNSKKQGRNHAKENYLLSGLIYCGECDGAMCGNRLVKSNGAVYAYYECVNHKQTKTCGMKRIKKEYVEAKAIEMLKEHIFSEKAIERLTNDFYKAVHDANNTTDAEIKKLKDLISDLDTKINNAVEFVLDGKGTPAVREKLEMLETQKLQHQTRIDELKVKNKITKFNADEIRDYIQKHNIDHCSDERIKNILQAFVVKVVVYRDEIQLHPKLGNGWYLQSVSVRIPTRVPRSLY